MLRQLKNRIINKILSWIESLGSKMNSYAWNKRWVNRETGYGYVKKEKEK